LSKAADISRAFLASLQGAPMGMGDPDPSIKDIISV